MGDGEDARHMFKLACKNVRNWRFRQSGWQRHSRLAAKEFRLPQPFMENLYSPASLSSTPRLLAGLCCSDSRLCLYRGDIEHAHYMWQLMVPDTNCFTICLDSEPNWRLAGKLKSDLEGDGLKAVLELQHCSWNRRLWQYLVMSMTCRTQGTCQTIGSEDRGSQMWSVQRRPWYGKCHLLKRKFSCLNGCILAEQDTKPLEPTRYQM